MVLKIFLQGENIRRSCRIFTFQIILNKIKPRKARRYAISWITWTNHSKKATRMSQTKALMSIWPSSRDVLQWHNIWKWGFKLCFVCASSNGYLFEFDLNLVKKQNVKVNLGEGVVIQLSENSQTHFPLCFLITFSIVHYW